MKRKPLFLDRQNLYRQHNRASKTFIQIQYDSNQNPNNIPWRTRENNAKTWRELAIAVVGKKGNVVSTKILHWMSHDKAYSNKNNMLVAKQQTCESAEQTRICRTIRYTQLPYLWQSGQILSCKAKIASLINVAGITGYLHAKSWT